MARTVTKRSVVVGGHRTSVSLEAPFWDALHKIAHERGATLNLIVSDIDKDREGNLSSAIRVFVLNQAITGAMPPASPAIQMEALQ